MAQEKKDEAEKTVQMMKQASSSSATSDDDGEEEVPRENVPRQDGAAEQGKVSKDLWRGRAASGSGGDQGSRSGAKDVWSRRALALAAVQFILQFAGTVTVALHFWLDRRFRMFWSLKLALRDFPGRPATPRVA